MRIDRICYIVGAMAKSLPDISRENSFVIAADAGYKALQQVNIKPDLVVGDFDSLGQVPEGENIVCHPVMKDDTDMMLAVKLGLERGYTRFHIYGGMGGRTDHTIANIQTLAYIAGRGASAFLFGDGEVMTVIKNSTLSFPSGSEGTVSAFAIGGKAVGVYESGLLYSLENAELTPDFPLGVSNEFTGKAAHIKVENGMLLVVWTDKAKLADHAPHWPVTP